MKLETEFYKLPLKFDIERLKAEIAQFTEAEWEPHPQGFPGNSALLLVTAHGDPHDNALQGPMQPTPHLKRCPYLQQVLASFGTVIGRTRLMRLGAEAQVTPHTDANYYWQQRVRVHVPIQTYPEVKFICGDASAHMGAGEAWIFDTFKIHDVINPTTHTRIHLVADTVGSAAFWDLVERAEKPALGAAGKGEPATFVTYDPNKQVQLRTESFNAPIVMSPWEQRYFIDLFWESFWDADNPESDDIHHLEQLLTHFQQDWLSLWAEYRDTAAGFPVYQAAVKTLEQQLSNEFGDSPLKISNGTGIVTTLKQLLVMPAVNPDLAPTTSPIALTSPATPTTEVSETVATPSLPATPLAAPATTGSTAPQFDRPIFIIAAPRSGSTFLFETLKRSPSLLTIGGESHGIFESIPTLNPAQRKYASNALDADDVTPEIAAQIKQHFLEQLEDFQGQKLTTVPSQFRFLEKTPKNALRIPFLNAIFPDARFIYLYREPRSNIGSIIDAWHSGRFVTYRNLPGWTGKPWSLLLIPEWQRLKQKSIPKIAAAQWQTTHQVILKDFASIPNERICGVDYDDLVKDPQREIERLCAFAEVDWTVDLHQEELPLSKFTVTPPHPDKWKKHAAALKTLLPKTKPTDNKVKRFIQTVTAVTPTTAIASSVSPTTAPTPEPAPEAVSEENIHHPPQSIDCSDATSFAELLTQFKTAVTVTAPLDNLLINLCGVDGQLKSYGRTFTKPQAFCIDNARLDLVTEYQLSHFRNMTAVASKLEPKGFYDAAYLHRKSHVLGELGVEDLGNAQSTIWGVSSRFSCLFTIDAPYSFIPRWKPAFLKTLNPDDACHLNGLAIADGLPKYVTALSAKATPQGWKKTAMDQGILMDVEQNEIIIDRLHSPTSPRWYQDQLWLIESTTGMFSRVDLQSRKLENIAKIPGFLRSLCFMGHYALIATDHLPNEFKGTAGIWVIDLQTGAIKTYTVLPQIQRLFAVQAIPQVIHPDVMNFDEPLISMSYALSDDVLQDVALSR